MSTPWILALGDRAGPLADVASRFIEARGVAPFPAGANALRRLAGLLDQWVEEGGDGDDDAFVEGAGALLGLTLIDHFDSGRHASHEGVHRIALGTCGSFDPFGAVEGALEAEDPRMHLAQAVRLADAEARGEGPVARTVTRFLERLESQRPGIDVLGHFGLRVFLSLGTESVEVDLGRVIRTLDDADVDNRALTRSVEKIITMLPGGEEAGSSDVQWEEARERIFPRLVGSSFLKETGTGLLTVPLGHDVHVAFVLDYGDRSRYVRKNEPDAWGMKVSATRMRALENLAERSDQARFGCVNTGAGPMVVARSGDGLDAARLLLPGLYEVLAPELGPRIVVGVPHRDTLLAAPADSPEAVDALRARTADDAQRAPHRISAALFEITDEGLRPR